MNYLQIVLNGYSNQNTREYLGNYFFREFKKAETEHYSITEFFKGCIEITKEFEKDINNQFYKRKNELYTIQSLVKTEKKTEKEKNEMIGDCKCELENITVDNFSVSLHSITNGIFIGSLWMYDVNNIRKGILDAIKTAEPALLNSKDNNENLNTSKDRSEPESRYWLTTFYDNIEQENPPYKSFKIQIENKGSLVIAHAYNVKVYTPELAVILTSKELLVLNMETKTDTEINGSEYFKTYVEGYKEGEIYFEKEYKVSSNTLYGANAGPYVKDLHLNFFHIKHIDIKEGWSFVKNQYPLIVTHKIIKEFGYYSGIVNKVEEQVKKYPQLFATFDKCEHNPIQDHSEKENEVHSENNFTLSTIEDWLFEFKEKMSVKDYKNLSSALLEYFETGKFPKLLNTIQINGRINKKLFGWALNRIFEAKGKGIEKELLKFAKDNISLFKDVQFDENNILNCNLYKYFTTKTK